MIHDVSNLCDCVGCDNCGVHCELDCSSGAGVLCEAPKAITTYVLWRGWEDQESILAISRSRKTLEAFKEKNLDDGVYFHIEEEKEILE